MNLEQILLELDRLIRTSGITTCALLPPNHDICLRMRQIPFIISQSLTPMQTMLTFVEKVVYMLYRSNTSFALEAYTGFLQSLFELSGEIEKETLSWIVYSDDERKYNAPVVAMMMRHEMIPLEEYDIQLAKNIRKAHQDVVAQYAVELLSLCLLSPAPITLLEDHALTLAALREMESPPSSVILLLDELRRLLETPYQGIEKNGIDCMEIRMMLAEWARLCQYSITRQGVYREIARKALRLAKGKEGQSFFFRLCTETCVDQFLSFKTLSSSFQKRAMHLTDAYAKLVAYMVRMVNQDGEEEQIAIASRALSVVILVLTQHHETRHMNFNQKAFMRILSSLYAEMAKIKNLSLNAGILGAYCDTLYMLQPNNYPGFAFSWLQLISHRTFMPQLLAGNDSQARWMICQKLVLGLLKFLGPLLDRNVLQKATRQFYRGTLRFLVVLLHDFPEFLSEHYMIFVQVIPHSCIQLRNIVLSAFPRVMHLPDPFTPDLRMDQLVEFKQDPQLVTTYSDVLKEDFQLAIGEYVKDQNEAFFTVALDHITSDRPDIIRAFVLYIGSKSATNDGPIEENPAIIAYKRLLTELPPEGCYTLLNAIADHLRYPNNHTYIFSKGLLHLFATQTEDMKEQITRVLLERLIVNRPHPWGLLATFIGLIKSPGFWDHAFIRCAPDIERLFDNVSRYINHTS
ncbi:CCR4-Not complex component, Not1-domain-containing protein [Dichotomocladium elegans]|nr:CCR4-Not complex component, Not1-domain-containing protein [Dichotomocladium elegans]